MSRRHEVMSWRHKNCLTYIRLWIHWKDDRVQDSVVFLVAYSQNVSVHVFVRWYHVNQPKATSDCKFSPDEFADFFQNKVSKIRLSTSNANPPVIEPRQFPALSDFRPVTSEEILKIVGASPAKHCMLDPAPTWLIKRLVPDLAGTITKMCNMSLEEGNFPNMLKATIVRPRLKKNESRSGRHEFLSTNFQSDIPVEDSRKGCRDQVRRACRTARAPASSPICLSFIPRYRNSCFSCSQ